MTSPHAFATLGGSPLVVDEVSMAAYACICGMRGTYAEVSRHLLEQPRRGERVLVEAARDDSDTAVVRDSSSIDIDSSPIYVDDFGGNTMGHYLPNKPREPAPLSALLPPSSETPPPPIVDKAVQECPFCKAGVLAVDLAEIAAWSCGHWVRKEPRSVAEAFQDMLQQAFEAGLAAARSGEAFETWYQREVLR